MKQIRKRLTYANVMSSIAVFLILGGATAFAAKKIGSNEIKANAITTGKIEKEAVTTAKVKKNAITTAKVKDGAITGSKVNASTLGTVPSATNAGNAETVGGNRVVSFSLVGHSPIGETKILDLNGLQIFASCPGGGVTATARTTVGDGEISAFSFDASSEGLEGNYEDTFNPGVDFVLPATTSSDEIGQGRYSGGNLKFIDFTYNEEDEVGGNDCVFHGFATSN